MRRLWSHIILAATALTMVGATFATVVTNIDSNIEYTSGREYVFRVSEKGPDGNPVDEILDSTHLESVKEIASLMEDRLKTANVSRYEVAVQGNDTIKVTCVQETDQQYEILKNYLPFNASLAISNSKGDYALASEFLLEGKDAYLKSDDNTYPQVIIPIDKENEAFQVVYTAAKEMADNNTGEVVEQHEHEEGEEEHEDTHRAYLYLWYNFVPDYYSYDKINQNSPDTYDPTIATKILMTFDASSPFSEDEDDGDALRAYIAPNTSEDSADVTAESLKNAYESARYYVNLLNAGEIDENYTVSYLFSEKAPMWVETGDGLISLGAHLGVAWSRTFIATLVAVVVVSLLLVYFYRLGALSIATTSIVSIFSGLIFIAVFSAEFSIAGVIGLISLAITSIISGVIYLNKLKEECYRGRSLKKANSEAAKKALLPTIDIHVVLVAVGVGAYLLGGPLMKGFALCTILGGIVSLVLNIFGLRGLLWLATNEPGINNRYDLFDVSSDQVPNALEEEKQKYFGANADRDFTKSKKPVGIVAGALLLGSIVAMIVSGVVNKGAVYAPSNEQANSQVYVEYRSTTANNTYLSATTKEYLNTLLENSYYNGNKLSSYVDKIDSYDYVSNYRTTLSGLTNVYYGYYRVSFNTIIKAGENGDKITYQNGETVLVEATDPETYFDASFLNSTSGANLQFDAANVTISFKNSKRVNADQPEFSSLILATTVAVGIAFVYLLLRYRLSRGIATLGITVLSVGITAGIFAILRFVPVTSYISVALPLVAMFALDIAILFMNKEREMVLEDRSKDNSIEARDKLMVRALGISSTPIMVSFIIALYLGVNYFGFMINSVSWVFLLICLGTGIATAMVLILFGPLAQILFRWFSGINIARPKANKKAKARPVRAKKSAEPEEAIFIGIND